MVRGTLPPIIFVRVSINPGKLYITGQEVYREPDIIQILESYFDFSYMLLHIKILVAYGDVIKHDPHLGRTLSHLA